MRSVNKILKRCSRRKRFAVLSIWFACACGVALAHETGFSFSDRIHPDLPAFVFTLQPAATAEENMPPQITTILIMGADGNPVQKIQDFTASPLIDEDKHELEGFVVEDMNFDGYKDLRLVEFLPAGPNIPYLVWLYDTAQKQFVATRLFAEIPSPEVDLKHRRIVSRWRNGAAEHGVSYYEYDGTRLIQVRETTETHIEDSKSRLIVRELKNGVLVEVKNEIVDIDSLDD